MELHELFWEFAVIQSIFVGSKIDVFMIHHHIFLLRVSIKLFATNFRASFILRFRNDFKDA